MDHEYHPYYSDRVKDGREPTLTNAFLNVIEILRGMLSREPERFPQR